MNLCIGGAFFIMEHYKNLSLESITYLNSEGIWCTEIWKDIVNYERLYQVSDLSRIKSLERLKGGKLNGKNILVKERIITISKSTNNYLQVGLCKDGISRFFRLHRVVAIAFIPNPKNKPEVNHKNGIKTDVRLSNLEWSTKPENAQHAFDTGLHIPHDCKGVKNGRAKLTEEQVKEIIELLPECSNSGLARKYNLTATTIRDIRHNKLWKNIPRLSQSIIPSMGKNCLRAL